MKFKLIEHDEKYLLVLATGELKYLSPNEVRDFVLHYDSLNLSEGADLSDAVNSCEGKTIAILDEDNRLIVCDAEFLRSLAMPTEFPYYTTSEYAELYGRSVPIVLRHCREGRIPGAINVGAAWFIPKNAAYPKDNRAGRDMSKRDYKKSKK